MLRAMGATVDRPTLLNPVADHPTMAVGAGRGQGVNCAFERIERVRRPRNGDGERLVVLVPAHFTCHHDSISLGGRTRIGTQAATRVPFAGLCDRYGRAAVEAAMLPRSFRPALIPDPVARARPVP